MIATLLMFIGACVWLAGELYGVFSHGPTTSGYVWSAEKKWPAARIIVAAGVVVLFSHFLFRIP